MQVLISFLASITLPIFWAWFFGFLEDSGLIKIKPPSDGFGWAVVLYGPIVLVIYIAVVTFAFYKILKKYRYSFKTLALMLIITLVCILPILI